MNYDGYLSKSNVCRSGETGSRPGLLADTISCKLVRMKVYGPYFRRDGRKHVVIVNDDKSKTTVSYPKWLMEQVLGRKLLPDETVDHIDRDFTNDNLSNLQILLRPQHGSIDHKRVKMVIQQCITCGKDVVRRPNYIRGNSKKNKAGPFCKSCAGKYGTDLQNGKITEPLPAQTPVSSEYYYLDK